MSEDKTTILKIALPKGRQFERVSKLLNDAGIEVQGASRNYRPTLSLGDTDTKLLKPQNIVQMIQRGTRDLGFVGADWVAERKADVVELLDTEFDPVRIVVAAPLALLEDGSLPDRPLVVATEYEELARQWLQASGREGTVVRSYGATEVLPPEDADLIIDNTSTGDTLRANNLTIIDEVMTSSTRLVASSRAWADPDKRPRIDDFLTLCRGVLMARQRLLIEVNVSEKSLAGVLKALPAMRNPTVSALADGGAFAVRAAIDRRLLSTVVPAVKAAGGTDIVVTQPGQIVP